jgi:cardiolipin synthase
MTCTSISPAKLLPGFSALAHGSGSASNDETGVWGLQVMHVSMGFFVFAWIVIGWQLFLLLMALFEPALRYRIERLEAPEIGSERFVKTLEALTDAEVNQRTSVTVLTNGEQFYEAELTAIRQATRSINLEAYIFQKGEVTRRFLDALTERAQAGVKVNLVLDGLGSFGTTKKYYKALTNAGGRVEFYHNLSWKSLARFNNRTHREILIVDGTTGFIGGAGLADHWLRGKKDHPRWRDTMLRVQGDVVCNLQATFAENWLESCGEVIFGEEYFPFTESEGRSEAMIINSAPSAGGSTRARILFQAMIAAARRSICITSPYFLPDASMLKELINAHRRHVEVSILVPGKKSDHLLTRSSSQSFYGSLLQAGVEIYEYQPSMVHAKILIVDGLWSVVGSTNFDNRSFGLNDEVNMAVRDQAVSARLLEDFMADLAVSKRVTLEEWKRRPLLERAFEGLGRIVQRQQ